MTEKLDELQDYPTWIDALTKEQQHEWYLRIKNSIPLWKNLHGNVSDLEQAIKDYEIKNNIV